MTNGESGPSAYRPRYGPVDGPEHGEYSAADDGFSPVPARPFEFGGTSDDTDQSLSASSAPATGDPALGRATQERLPRKFTPALGVLALVLAASTVVLLSAGISLAVDGDYAASTAVAFAGITTSILGFLLGGIAVITRRGRWAGAIGMAVSVVANPVVLTHLLAWASGLVAA